MNIGRKVSFFRVFAADVGVLPEGRLAIFVSLCAREFLAGSLFPATGVAGLLAGVFFPATDYGLPVTVVGLCGPTAASGETPG